MTTLIKQDSQFTSHLDKGSKKFNCPACGQKRFVLYVNSDTKDYLHESVGRCDREQSCSYHFTPKEYFTENKIPFVQSTLSRPQRNYDTVSIPISYLPFDIMERSVLNCQKCNLFPFLERLFGVDIAKGLCNDYFIGTSKAGDAAFWQVDVNARIRQAKVMKYDSCTGKRNKQTGAFFSGKKILNDENANLQQCFFGEYLLSFPENKDKPVAIIESEKGAMIASVYYPGFVWLATGGKHGAKWTEEKVCKVLAGRKVVLFPDLGAFDTWKAKGLLIAAVAGCEVAVSDILEKNANTIDKAEGLDLIDYLLRLQDSSALALVDGPYPVIWDYNAGFKSIK